MPPDRSGPVSERRTGETTMFERTPTARAGASVAIVEDDRTLSRTIADLLRHAGYRVETFTSGEAFLADGALPGCFDCALLDLRLPGISGLDVLAALRQAGSPLPVLFLTGHADITLAVEAMKLGAADFLEKPYAPAALLAAAAKACAGSAERRRLEKANRRAANLIGSLTPRQREVLEGMAKGESSKIMAHRLGLSVRTVEMHRAHLMARLGARSSLEAVRLALEAGFSVP